ncbi:MAG: type VI secretion system domain-containing protein, partial [Gemmatimonadota bacterium]|nr:type VI secretion system domain-containing protein [Gemmatimonadota bacterium]
AQGAGTSQLLRLARSRVRNGQPDQAVELLLKASEQAHHPREAFLTRTEAAAVMVDNGLESVARPILDDMMALIESHSLDGWESGDTVAKPLGLLYRVRRAAGEGAEDLYERIVRLDPVHAMRLRSEERSREREGYGTEGSEGSGGDAS